MSRSAYKQSGIRNKHQRHNINDAIDGLFLDCEVAVVSEPSQFVSSVACEDIAPRVRLKVPRRHQNDVSNPDPHSSLELPPDPAETLVTILTLHHDSFKPEQFCGNSKNIGPTWQLHLAKVFTHDLSLSQLDVHLSAGVVATASSVSVKNTIFLSRFGEGRTVEPNCEGPRVIWL